MALRITDAKITRPDTEHTATAWPVPGEPALWTVSWLPGRNLTHSQAVTAMKIAEMCAGPIEPGSVRWVHVAGWAEELHLAAAEAVRLASAPPPWTS